MNLVRRNFPNKLPNWALCKGGMDERFFLPRAYMDESECPVCGLTYVAELEHNRRQHRDHHARALAVVDPKPSVKLKERLETHNNATLVDCESPLWMHREMYERAWRFNRELNYFGIMWSETGQDEDIAEGRLIVDFDTHRILGAASFRWREVHYSDDDIREGWGLQWIYIAPIARRTGLLTKHWPEFEEAYGNFWIEGPLTEGMLDFVNKRGLLERVLGPLKNSFG